MANEQKIEPYEMRRRRKNTFNNKHKNNSYLGEWHGNVVFITARYSKGQRYPLRATLFVIFVIFI